MAKPLSVPKAKIELLRQTSDYPFPLVVIEGSEVLRCGRDESHVSSDLEQLPVALRFSGMCRLERVDLQAGSWV